MPTRFIQITDLHLSDRTDTPASHALQWAIETTNKLKPDFVVISGDMTTYGSKQSAQNVLRALKKLRSPVFFTPGNADLRSPQAMPLFTELKSAKCYTCQNLRFLFPNTAQGTLCEYERKWLQENIHPTHEHILITHYPIDALDEDSQRWLTQFLSNHNVTLYLAGHKHLHRIRQMGTCQEVITRGLDPDKASGHLSGISLFQNTKTGQWSEEFIPWSYPISLHPTDIQDLPSPIGWSIQGDPILAAQETRHTDLNVLELRPKKLDFSVSALQSEILGLRNNRPLYLSWHLPNLFWQEGTKRIEGITEIKTHLAIAREIGVDHLTVHVPQLPAKLMSDNTIWSEFEDTYDAIFRDAVSSGIRLAIENVHNNPGVSPDDPTCKFATDIPGYLKWISTITARFADIPNAQVGSHFDVGHARNNGEYGNMHPLGDWYASIGKEILGYHIHQIRTDPDTGKLANHKEMFSLFEQRISYAGFLHAWSTHQINRAPLFVEIRNANERRRSTRRLQDLFLNASQYRTSTDLPLSFI